MKFEKRNFMGIELDVLVGHPEHDVLFIATQVARSAGLKNPSNTASVGAKYTPEGALRINELPEWRGLPINGRQDIQTRSWLFTEAATYQMLLRGHAPASEPFRKWVTEEVLPSIRKTGKYNAAESDHPIAQGIMDRLMSLEGIVLKQTESIQALRQELQAKTFSLEAPAPEVSPYEGQEKLADVLGRIEVQQL